MSIDDRKFAAQTFKELPNYSDKKQITIDTIFNLVDKNVKEINDLNEDKRKYFDKHIADILFSYTILSFLYILGLLTFSGFLTDENFVKIYSELFSSVGSFCVFISLSYIILFFKLYYSEVTKRHPLISAILLFLASLILGLLNGFLFKIGFDMNNQLFIFCAMTLVFVPLAIFYLYIALSFFKFKNETKDHFRKITGYIETISLIISLP